MLAKHINALTTHAKDTSASFQVYHSQIFSFMTSIDHRLHNAAQGIHFNHNEMNRLTANISFFTSHGNINYGFRKH